MMKKLFLMIPNVEPRLEISCQDEKIMEYLYNMFSPYVSHQCQKGKYESLIFYKNDYSELMVERNDGKEKLDVDIVTYLETYLLENSCVDKGYLMLHGGGVAHNNHAFIFLANSMVGKSTLITHLCMEGFEYITDDRLIIDTTEKTVLPFTKTIMLRPDGKKILLSQYEHSLDTITFKHKKRFREFFLPPLCKEGRTQISCIFILIRQEGQKIRREEVVKRTNRVNELLKYSMSIKGCENIGEFVKLSSIRMEIVYYSDLNEITSFLKEMSNFS